MVEIRYNQGQHEIWNGDTNTPIRDIWTDTRPRDLIEASIALCSSRTLVSLMERDGLLRADTAFVMSVSGELGDHNRYEIFRVTMHFPEGMDAGYRQKCMTIAERGCRIGNTIRKGARVEIAEG